jgi:ribosomal-protein-alanine N-acetyltransferase
MTEEYSFRFMTAEDIPAVMAIEEDVHIAPWTEQIFADCLRVAYHAEVMTSSEDEVVGYFVLSVAAGEAHLFNVCVSRQWQGKGLGRMMVARCIDVARIREAESVFLEVRPSNLSLFFLKSAPPIFPRFISMKAKVFAKSACARIIILAKMGVKTPWCSPNTCNPRLYLVLACRVSASANGF